MKSVTVKVRMREDEKVMLDQMVGSNVAGCGNAAEWFRMLLWREWRRRRGLGKVKASDYQTDFRTGRPTKDKE